MSRTPGDPRNGYTYRVTVARMLASDDLCHLCGHHGARTADHIISVREWLRRYGTYAGVNHPSNMRPAHGTMGRIRNRCPECKRLCNQQRGSRTLTPARRSQDW